MDGRDVAGLVRQSGGGMNRSASRPVTKAYPWILVGLLWTVSCLNAADRSIFNTVKPLLRLAFHVNDIQLGLVDTTFFWAYALGAFLFGRIGDSVRRRNLILFGLVFWSSATGMMPLASSFALLLGMRGLVAVGESTYYPSATALISRWHGPSTRSRALSMHQTAIFVGGGAGSWVAGRLADAHGWAIPFAVFAGAGLAFAGVLAWVLRDDVPGHAFGHGAAGRPVPAEPVAAVLANPAALVICVVYMFASAASSAVLNWCNVYAHDALGLDLADSALVGPMMITTAGFFAVLVGGWLADRLAVSSSMARFTVLLGGLMIAAVFLALFPLAHSAIVVGLLLFATSFGKGLFDGCIYAALFDVVADDARATATGMMTMIGFFGAGVTTTVLPLIASIAGLAAAFGMMAGLYAAAVLILMASRPTVRRVIALQAHAV